MEKPKITAQEAKKRNIIAGIVFLVFMGFVYFGISWLNEQPKEANALAPFRKILSFNEKVAKTIGNPENLSPEYDKSKAAKPARANGRVGMSMVIDPLVYKFTIENPLDTQQSLHLGLADLKKLPYKDLVFDFKCIEGWSQVQHWGGARFRDVVAKYHLASKTGEPVTTGLEPHCYKYVGMETPDGKYYVGIDMPSAMQAQTILAWNMNDAPLPQNQGAPLRLIIPIKYGVKHIKQIGKIFFSDVPPRDYWADRGYDYDSGL